MANNEHLKKLQEGIDTWNHWRDDNPELKVDLSGANLNKANLSGIDLYGADLRGANLSWSDFSWVNFHKVDLRWTNLIGANLHKANLTMANLHAAELVSANLHEADLRWANLHLANLREADLTGANLSLALLIKTKLDDAQLDDCRIYGISVWDVSLKGTSQQNLVITAEDQDTVTVDDIKLSQFIYLLLGNEEVRHIIDTITSKVVLILGRFTEERKKVLNALRREIRARNYTPIMFDFEKPKSRDLSETIITLASMSRFVIADLSAAKSLPQELTLIIPNLPSVPIQPMLLTSDREYAMFEHWTRYPWVLPAFLYEDEADLLYSLTDKVIEPAEQMCLKQTKE